MNIAEPSYLLLIWIVPVLVAFYLWSFRTRDRLLAQFARAEMLARLLPPLRRGRQRLKATIVSTAVVFALFSLLRPQWGFKWEEITRQGVDIMVAVDVSQSMKAEDVQPDRLTAARHELADLLNKLQGDRIGLIAFAGTAFVQCPLTLDYGAFAMFLDYLSPDLIPVPGTSITQAIKVAKESFLKSQSTSRALILITDGEDHEGDPLAAAKEAKAADIHIYTIGIGAKDGAPVPSPDGSGFLKDENGQVALTRLDEETLQKIALETGGAYVRSTSGDLDLDEIYLEGIRKNLKASDLSSTRQKRWEERFQWPLAVAVLLLMLEPLLGETRKRRPAAGQGLSGDSSTGSLSAGGAASGKSKRTKGSRALAGARGSARVGVVGLLLVGAALLSLTTSAQAGLLRDDNIEKGLASYNAGDYETALQKFTDAQIDHPDDPLLDYNLGNTYYKTRRFEEAATSYQRVLSRSPDPKLKERAWYNLGNTSYKQGKLEDAVNQYLEALKLDPQDEAARKNLEKTREEIRRRLEQNKQQQQQQQQKQQQQAQQQKQQQQQQGDQGGGQNQPQQGSDQGQEQSKAGQEQGQPQQGQQGQQDPQSQQAQQGQQGQEQQQGQKGQEGQQGQQAQQGQQPDQKNAQGDQQQGQQAQAAQAAQEDGKKSGQDGQQAQAMQAGEAGQKGPLSKEDANRILQQVQDAQPNGLKAPPMRGRAARVPGGIPW